MPKEKFKIEPQVKKEKPETQLEKDFKLREQYEEQVKTLHDLGFLELDERGKIGVVDILGVHRPIPKYEDIVEEMAKKAEFFDKKREQGFTQLLIVPFGAPLKFMIDRTRDLISKKSKEGKLLTSDGKKKVIKNPIYVENADMLGELVYYPTEFDEENHGGRTKKAILEDKNNSFPGYNIILLDDNVELPGIEDGSRAWRVLGGRKELESNHRPDEYLELTQEDEQYKGEQGLTLEDWLTYFMYYLQNNNKLITDGDKEHINFGSFNPKEYSTPLCSWDSRDRYLILDELPCNDHNKKYSTRFVVPIG